MFNFLNKSKRKELIQKNRLEVKKLIRDNKNSLITLSIYDTKFFHFIAHIINLGARLKGRIPYNHSAIIYNYEKYRLLESKKPNINLESIDYYFRPKFKGKIRVDILKPSLNEEKRQQLFNDSLDLNANPKIHYSVKAAVKAWFDLGKEQKDNPNEIFCTDVDADFINKYYYEKIELNSREVTPAQLPILIKDEIIFTKIFKI